MRNDLAAPLDVTSDLYRTRARGRPDRSYLCHRHETRALLVSEDCTRLTTLARMRSSSAESPGLGRRAAASQGRLQSRGLHLLATVRIDTKPAEDLWIGMAVAALIEHLLAARPAPAPAPARHVSDEPARGIVEAEQETGRGLRHKPA